MRVLISCAIVVLVFSCAVTSQELTCPLQFVDDWPSGIQPGRSMAILSSAVPEGLRPPAEGLLFGQIALPGGKTLLIAAQVGAEGRVVSYFVDVNLDGQLGETEAVPVVPMRLPAPLGEIQGAQAQVTIPVPEGEPRRRTVVITPGPLKALTIYRFRGHYAGQCDLAGARRAVMLVDANLNGSFNQEGIDILLLDINGDGQLTKDERRAPRGSLEIDGLRYVAIATGDGSSVRFIERPVGEGQLVIRIPEGIKVSTCDVSLRFETGGPELVPEANQPVTVPAGLYHVASASITVTDEAGKEWDYYLSGLESVPLPDGDPSQLISVEPRGGTIVDLFADCKLSVTADAKQVKPGGSAGIDIAPRAGYGTRIMGASDAQAEIVVLKPDGTELSHGKAGFG